MLCSICTDLFTVIVWQPHPADGFGELFLQNQPFAAHHASLESLQKSAHECSVCCRVLKALVENYPDVEGFAGTSPAYLTVAFGDRPDTGMMHTVDIALFRGWEEHVPHLFEDSNCWLESFDLYPTEEYLAPSNYRISTPSTDIRTTFPIVQEWLDFCTLTHPNCERLRDCKWFPTRLLAVGDADRVKLTETNTHKPSGPYMTLSHTWGDSPIAKLTHGNLEDFKRGFAISSLPPTFIEAIHVARTLEIQYLWIDCLCILQDSHSDWAHESSLMAEVYRNSFCNIGASAATNSAGGLFRSRDIGLVDSYLFIHGGKQYAVVWRSVSFVGIEGTPLCKRGWVVQERWLCPRMLHFSSEQIFWECRTATACESSQGLSRPYPHELMRKVDVSSSSPERFVGHEPAGVLSGSLGNPWNTLVFGYSAANLTFQTDKMVAFAGLAKTFQALEPTDRYIAGLWERNFVVQLLWHVVEPKRYLEYIAPSWSWASIDGGVWPFHGPMYSSIRQISRLVDHHLKFRSPDTWGQLESGWMYLQGPIYEVMLRGTPMSKFPYSCTVLTHIESSSTKHRLLHATVLDHVPEGGDITGHLFYMPLALTETASEDVSSREKIGTSFDEAHGILLRQDEQDFACFTRVGYCRVLDGESVQALTRPTEVESLSHLPFDPEKGHTVKLI